MKAASRAVSREHIAWKEDQVCKQYLHGKLQKFCTIAGTRNRIGKTKTCSYFIVKAILTLISSCFSSKLLSALNLFFEHTDPAQANKMPSAQQRNGIKCMY